MADTKITRNKIAGHYKKFFAIENMELAENDQLMIDWGIALIEYCRAQAKTSNENGALPIPDASQQRELLMAFLDWYYKNGMYYKIHYDTAPDEYFKAINCG